MGRRIVFGGYHPAERKKTATLRLSSGCHLTEKSWMEVVCPRACMCTDAPCPTIGWPPRCENSPSSLEPSSWLHQSGST
ncbi:unnamed protein product [Spirodela intermedia]|uniref:Uncharacterized protein n=1 Tax=Spirodela intermedia TaxID=51605 RepID=A0ABN7E9Z0_SPIIN|nr:unnamed protein product [Spirodela intermedia]